LRETSQHIDKSRKEYDRRFRADQDHRWTNFHHWMDEILAGGDSNAWRVSVTVSRSAAAKAIPDEIVFPVALVLLFIVSPLAVNAAAKPTSAD